MCLSRCLPTCLYDMILVLGPCGSGKSTLLRRLSSASTTAPARAPHPTCGSELVHVPSGPAGRRHVVCREVGGALYPLWSSYLTAEVAALIFVLDASDPSQLSLAAACLIELLSNRLLFSRSVLVLLNKSDSEQRRQVCQVATALRLSDLKRTFPGRLDCVSCDAASGVNTDRVASWISNLQPRK